jgi:hypothetical protein
MVVSSIVAIERSARATAAPAAEPASATNTASTGRLSCRPTAAVSSAGSTSLPDRLTCTELTPGGRVHTWPSVPEAASCTVWVSNTSPSAVRVMVRSAARSEKLARRANTCSPPVPVGRVASATTA